MKVYADAVMLLNFAVDFLLLLGTNRLAGFSPAWGRSLLAAALGGVYGGMCILPGFTFLGNTLWRLVFLALMSLIAFGCNEGALRRGVLFVFLCMALGGIAMGFRYAHFWLLILAAAGVWLMCGFGFRGRADGRRYVPVTITHQGQTTHLTALVDTGNTLTDPLTGESVLVAGAQIGQRLLGLSPQQLSSPVETMLSARIPGLRLLPYSAVGKSGGMLLAMRCDRVHIGNREGAVLVAFSPDTIGQGNAFQALTGGIV